MNILLISAGRSSFKGALWGAYDFEIPLNVAYVAAYLEKNHYPTQVIDLQLPSENLETRIHMMADINHFAFVGISSNLSLYKEAYQAVALLREKHYQGQVFIFGPLGLHLQERIFDECEGTDFVIYGEEEPTILDLINNHTRPETIRGICYSENGIKRKTPKRDYLDNIDLLPFPARDKFDMEKYFPTPGKYYVLPQITMLSSRGCKNNCLFCPKTGGRQLRLRSPENIVAEIDEAVGKYQAREINFIDELFGADRDATVELAELLLKRDYRLHLRICTHIHHIDKEILTLLKRAGLYSVGFGIESGSDDILTYNNKKIIKQQIREAVKLVKGSGLEIRGYFMLNIPGETRNAMEETKAFIRELDIDLVNIQIAYPYPGTAFYRLAENKYQIIKDRWDKWEYSDGDDVVFLQSDLTEEYILNAYDEIIKSNFLNIGFILKWLKRIKTFHDFKYSFLQFLTLVRGVGSCKL